MSKCNLTGPCAILEAISNSPCNSDVSRLFADALRGNARVATTAYDFGFDQMTAVLLAKIFKEARDNPPVHCRACGGNGNEYKDPLESVAA